jgi:hypothetical protein
MSRGWRHVDEGLQVWLGRAEAVQTASAMLRSINFSRVVLARGSNRLGVLPVHRVYWSNWGDPARILRDRAHFALRQPRECQATRPGVRNWRA